jgi:cerevisin
MRGLVALSLAACVAAAPTVSFETVHGEAAPILSSSNAEVVPNSYIVKFKKHVDDSSASAHQTWLQEVHTFRETERADLKKRGQKLLVDDVFHGLKHTYKIGQGFLGYSGHFDEETIEQVRRHPDVSYTSPPAHACLIGSVANPLRNRSSTSSATALSVR